MAGSGTFGRDPFRGGAPWGERPGQGGGPGAGVFEQLRSAPLWKLALLGGVAFGAAGTVVLGALLAAGALFLLALFFRVFFGPGRPEGEVAVPVPDPPPTYH